MKIQNILLSVTTLVLSGCSNLQIPFITGIQNTSVTATKHLEYNFSEPRRGTVDTKTISKLNTARISKSAYKYYSANGHECHNISTDFSRSACKINGNWQESAPVLVVHIPN